MKVLSEGVTAEETKILHQNVLGGTAGRSAINCPTAAKTGTTSELIDAWLDGYTPNYSTVVWMGYPNKRVSMTDVHGEPQQGGYLPAEIWHAYMSAVTEGQPCTEFPQPKEAISYKPFYGKYASTGRTQAGQEAQSEENKNKKQPKKPAEHSRKVTNRARITERARAPPANRSPPAAREGAGRAPSPPAAREPGIKKPAAQRPAESAATVAPKPPRVPRAGSLSADTHNERSPSR